jgi:hypothetical protein
LGMKLLLGGLVVDVVSLCGALEPEGQTGVGACGNP